MKGCDILLTGVLLDMGNPNSIITIATLAALYESSGNSYSDFLDIIIPFITSCLPTRIGSPVDLTAIKAKMERDYAFQISL